MALPANGIFARVFKKIIVFGSNKKFKICQNQVKMNTFIMSS